MSSRMLWGVLVLWCAGLLAGPSLRAPVFGLAALLAILLLLADRRVNLRGRVRAASLLACFLLAGASGARTFPGGAGFAWPPVKERLRNPTFVPLVWGIAGDPAEGARRTEGDPGAVPIVPETPPGWASPAVWALTLAVVGGRREALDPSWQQAFRRSGTAHLLAVSGLHVGILLGGMILLLRLFGMGRRHAGILALVGVSAYVVAIGAPPSAVRAAVMGGVGIAMLAGGRRVDGARLLPVALLGVLLVRPDLVVSAGLVLSASAVVGILLALRDAGRRAVSAGRLEALVRTGLGAQLGILPAQIHFFGTLHPWAPLVNLVAVPLAGIWLPAEAAGVLLEHLLPGAGVVTAPIAEGCGRILMHLVAWSANLPGAVVPVDRVLAIPALIGLAAWAGRRRTAALLVLAGVVWGPALSGTGTRVTFLDVGQGDAVVIETVRPRRVVVVDAGAAGGGWDAGRSVVVPYLAARGIHRIDVLIASHADNDHIGGMASLLATYPVGMFLHGGWPEQPGRSVAGLDRLVEDAGIHRAQVGAGDRIVLGEGATLTFPAGDASGRMSSNDRSVVCVLDLRGARRDPLRVVLAGDLEIGGESRLRGWQGYLRGDVLKASHHGSDDATSAWLLRTVSPRLVVVSAGGRNRYGHPGPEFLMRAGRMGTRLWRTDLEGALVLRP